MWDTYVFLFFKHELLATTFLASLIGEIFFMIFSYQGPEYYWNSLKSKNIRLRYFYMITFTGQRICGFDLSILVLLVLLATTPSVITL